MDAVFFQLQHICRLIHSMYFDQCNRSRKRFQSNAEFRIVQHRNRSI
jgi:hypothetical protein